MFSAWFHIKLIISEFGLTELNIWGRHLGLGEVGHLSLFPVIL